jgi:hypothetical protein
VHDLVSIFLCFVTLAREDEPRGWLNGWTTSDFEYAPQGLRFETH